MSDEDSGEVLHNHAVRGNGDEPMISPGQTVDDGSTIAHKQNAMSKNTTAIGLPQRRKKQFAVSVQWERQQYEQGNDPTAMNPQHRRCMTCTREDCYTWFCCRSRRVGNMFFLCERKDGTPSVVAGPCWPFCIFVTVPIIVIFSALVTYFVFFSTLARAKLPEWAAAIYLPIVGLTLGSLFLVSCRDPGILERVTDEEAGQSGWFWNEQVASYRPPGSLYCRECKVLIKEYDHLCPWTGTGIGGGNMLFFRIFVVMVNLLCYASIGLVAYILIASF